MRLAGAGVSKPRLWTGRRLMAGGAQAAVLGAAALIVWFAARNAVMNLGRLGINTGFGFLDRPAGVP